MSRTECTEALVDLGFTALEAEVYSVLVEHSPATAYKLAREIGKAAANVYKAVESLQRKGAILVEESSNRLCRAVPPAELVHQLERQFSQARTRAQRALARLTRTTGDERVYELGSSDQVLARARTMIGRSERAVLCDLFPEAAEELREDLQAAASRGRRVCVQVYRPIEFDQGVCVFLSPNGEHLLRVWPGQWLNVVADAREHLLAFLRHGLRGVHQAVYSESVYLSLLYSSGLSSEMVSSAVERLLDTAAAPKSLRDAFAGIRASVSQFGLPGYASLLQRFGGDTTSSTAGARRSSVAKPSRAKPSRAEPSRAGPSHGNRPARKAAPVKTSASGRQRRSRTGG